MVTRAGPGQLCVLFSLLFFAWAMGREKGGGGVAISDPEHSKIKVLALCEESELGCLLENLVHNHFRAISQTY